MNIFKKNTKEEYDECYYKAFQFPHTEAINT